MEKSKIVAALLAFLLGGLGIHKFYLGKAKAGVIHIALGVGGYVLAFIGISAVFAAGMSGSGGGKRGWHNYPCDWPLGSGSEWGDLPD